MWTKHFTEFTYHSTAFFSELDEETGLAEPDVSNCEMLCHSALAVVYENQ